MNRKPRVILTLTLVMFLTVTTLVLVATLRVTSMQSSDLRQDAIKAGFAPTNNATAADGTMQIVVLLGGCRVVLGRKLHFNPLAKTTEAIEPYWFKGVQRHEETTPTRNVTGLAPLTKESPTPTDVQTHLNLPANEEKLTFCLAG